VGDPESTYRTKDEVEEWRKKDPILRAGRGLLENGLSQRDLDAVSAKVAKEMEELEKWALAQEFPTLDEATAHVYIPLQTGRE
jgi:pyruvate dehydrogenase E1 component alpha subunit